MGTSKDRPAHIPHRFGRRARHGLSIARSLAGAGASRLLRGADARDDRDLGEALARELDQLKGMAMKVGQILSYMEALPEDTQRVLASLRRGAEPVAFDTIRGVVEQGLGAPLEDLFDRFEEEPVAAASIGQVHRAVVDGRDVAVKVRYPNIHESFDADLRQIGRLARVASAATAVDGQAIVEELHARLHEECDYRREARAHAAFRRVWLEDAEVIIPEVLSSQSAEAVLTTAWCEGRDFEDFCRSASQERRSAAGLTLARFAWRCFFVHRAINADPRPGNYLFPKQGVVFLDFGCVRRFEAGFVAAWRGVFRAVLDGRPGDFEAATRATGMVGDRRFDFEAHWEQMHYSMEPYLDPGFRFNAEYVRRAREIFGPDQANGRRMAVPPQWIWLARLQYGLHAVLARLGAEGDFAAVLRGAMAAPPEPMETG